MNSLPLFHRIADRKVVVLGMGEAADAKRRLVERAGGICVGEAEAHHAQLAFVVLDDEGEAKAAAMRLNLRNMWSRLVLTRGDVRILHGVLRQLTRR